MRMEGVYPRPGRRVMLAAMTPTPAAVALALRVLFLFGYALLFALVEIEIEGPHGWAERLPTWFRVRTPAARFYGLFMRGKPLTGYHAVMFVLPLWSFHIGFFAGVSWSWAAEAATLAAYLAWAVVWDLLWFLLNPRFGWARFRKGSRTLPRWTPPGKARLRPRVAQPTLSSTESSTSMFE